MYIPISIYTMDKKLIELRTLLTQTEYEISSLMKGRKASAPRARTSLQRIKTLAHALRSDIMVAVKEMPTKSRTKATVSSDEEKNVSADEKAPEAQETPEPPTPVPSPVVKKARKPRVKKV